MPKMDCKTHNIKKRLIEIDKTQQDLANHLGLTIGYVSNMINARKPVDLDWRLKIVAFLGEEPKRVRKYFTRKAVTNVVPKHGS